MYVTTTYKSHITGNLKHRQCKAERQTHPPECQQIMCSKCLTASHRTQQDDMVSDELSIFNSIKDPLYMRIHFFPAVFRIFFMSLTLDYVTMTCPGVDYFKSILLGIYWDFSICRLKFSSNLEKFGALSV